MASIGANAKQIWHCCIGRHSCFAEGATQLTVELNQGAKSIIESAPKSRRIRGSEAGPRARFG